MKFDTYEDFKHALENKNPDGRDDLTLAIMVHRVPIEWCQRILEEVQE